MSETQPSLLPDVVDAKEQHDKDHSQEQLAFEFALKDLPYGDVYASMIQQGFRWREAAFVAWSVAPKSQRQPATKQELAKLLGCAGSVISRFEMDRRLGVMRIKMAKLAYLDALPSIIEASIEVASKPSYKATPERNHVLGKVMQMGTDTVNVNVGQSAAQNFDGLSDEELAAMALEESGVDDE